MPEGNTSFDIRVVGNEAEIIEFVDLCKKVEGLSIAGAKRIIPVEVDGDGSAGLRFLFREKGEWKEMGRVQAEDLGLDAPEGILAKHHIGQ